MAGATTEVLLENVNASAISEAIKETIQNAPKNVALTASISPSTVTLTSDGGTVSVSLAMHKDGIINSPTNHPALVGEEGPELVETANGAYLAGANGPEITNINKGDTVHTAQETKKILRGNKHKTIPRFEDGYYSTAYGNTKNTGSGGNKFEADIDKLYNLLREIQSEVRYRNQIERRYERLLRDIDTSASDLAKISQEQLKALEDDKDL